MKLFAIFLLWTILLVSCTNISSKERIEFSKRLLANWDSVSYLIYNSPYYCNEKYYNLPEIKDLVENNKYEYYYDDIISSLSPVFNVIEKTYTFKRETVHRIVFTDLVKDKYITFDYFLKDGKWCYQSAIIGNALE